MARRRMLKAVRDGDRRRDQPDALRRGARVPARDDGGADRRREGRDLLAQRISAIAREHGVPIVENVPLAQALYKSAEVGDTIPAALFGAVAEVLAYLVRIKQLML